MTGVRKRKVWTNLGVVSAAEHVILVSEERPPCELRLAINGVHGAKAVWCVCGL
jgi:hypothetical protein